MKALHTIQFVESTQWHHRQDTDSLTTTKIGIILKFNQWNDGKIIIIIIISIYYY